MHEGEAPKWGSSELFHTVIIGLIRKFLNPTKTVSGNQDSVTRESTFVLRIYVTPFSLPRVPGTGLDFSVLSLPFQSDPAEISQLDGPGAAESRDQKIMSHA